MAKRNFHNGDRVGPVILEYVTFEGSLAVTLAAGVPAPGQILGLWTGIRKTRYVVNLAGFRRHGIGGHRAV